MAVATGRGFGMSARRLKRLERAVEGFLAQLQCAICLCVYDRPVSLPCNHCFCEECIHRALELKPVCPICKMPAKKRQLRRDAMIQQLLVATEKLQSAEPLMEEKADAPAQAETNGNGAAKETTTQSAAAAGAAATVAPVAAAADEEQPSNTHVNEENTETPNSIATESDQPTSAAPDRPVQSTMDEPAPVITAAENKQQDVPMEDTETASEPPNAEVLSVPAVELTAAASPAASTDEDIEMIEPPKPAVEGTAREPMVLYDTLVEESQLSEEPPLPLKKKEEAQETAAVAEEPTPLPSEPEAPPAPAKSEPSQSAATEVTASVASPAKQAAAKPSIVGSPAKHTPAKSAIVAASKPPLTPSVVSNEPRAQVSSATSDSIAVSRPRRKSRQSQQTQPEPESQQTEPPPPPLNGPFAVGDLVDVNERTWVGVNRPGGAARILKVNEDGTYDVRYIINSGKERGVHDFFIHRPNEDVVADTTPGRSVKQRVRRSRTSMSSPGTPLTGRSAHGSANGSANGKRKRSGMVFLCSGFTDSTMQNLVKWSKPLGASIVSEWTAEVTHLIVKCVSGKDGDSEVPRHGYNSSASPSNGGQRPTTPGKRKLFTDPVAEPVKRWVKLRSLKYLKALVGGRWIVSEEWLHGECSVKLLMLKGSNADGMLCGSLLNGRTPH